MTNLLEVQLPEIVLPQVGPLWRLKPVGDAAPEILPEKHLKLACLNFSFNRFQHWNSMIFIFACNGAFSHTPRSTVEKHSHRGVLVFWYFVPHTCGVLRNCRRKTMYSQCSCLWCALTATISLDKTDECDAQWGICCWDPRTHHQDTRKNTEDLWRYSWFETWNFQTFLVWIGHPFCPLKVHCTSTPWNIHFLRSIFWHARTVQHRWTNSGTLADDDNVVVFTSPFSWNALLARRKTTFSWAILLIEDRNKLFMNENEPHNLEMDITSGCVQMRYSYITIDKNDD